MVAGDGGAARLGDGDDGVDVLGDGDGDVLGVRLDVGDVLGDAGGGLVGVGWLGKGGENIRVGLGLVDGVAGRDSGDDRLRAGDSLVDLGFLPGRLDKGSVGRLGVDLFNRRVVGDGHLLGHDAELGARNVFRLAALGDGLGDGAQGGVGGGDVRYHLAPAGAATGNVGGQCRGGESEEGEGLHGDLGVVREAIVGTRQRMEES